MIHIPGGTMPKELESRFVGWNKKRGETHGLSPHVCIKKTTR